MTWECDEGRVPSTIHRFTLNRDRHRYEVNMAHQGIKRVPMTADEA
jgi:hypothetical protein